MPAAKRPKPIFFSSPMEFRDWLARHHASATELWVGFHKRATGRSSMTWSESVDEALCFGWIDGIRKSVDAAGYMIRFTPRKRGSTWSNVNLRKVKDLMRDGRMQPAGLEAYKAMKPEKSGIYSFEQRAAAALSAEEEKRFRRSPGAWRFFQSQPPGYRKLVVWWIVSGKREATRARRLQTLIDDSAAGRRIAALRPKTETRP